jgi:hypothetical protein
MYCDLGRDLNCLLMQRRNIVGEASAEIELRDWRSRSIEARPASSLLLARFVGRQRGDDRPALRVRELVGFFERVGAEIDREADGAPRVVRFSPHRSGCTAPRRMLFGSDDSSP